MNENDNLNFRIARLRHQMKGTQSDIRLLTNAGLDCANASERLRRMQADLLTLIARRRAFEARAEAFAGEAKVLSGQARALSGQAKALACQAKALACRAEALICPA